MESFSLCIAAGVVKDSVATQIGQSTQWCNYDVTVSNGDPYLIHRTRWNELQAPTVCGTDERRASVHTDRKATPMCSTECKISFSAGVMASRKCGVWLGTLVLGSLLPAVLVTFGVGNSILCKCIFFTAWRVCVNYFSPLMSVVKFIHHPT